MTTEEEVRAIEALRRGGGVTSMAVWFSAYRVNAVSPTVGIAALQSCADIPNFPERDAWATAFAFWHRRDLNLLALTGLVPAYVIEGVRLTLHAEDLAQAMAMVKKSTPPRKRWHRLGK